MFSESTFHLIDFGFSTRYKDRKSGEHIKQKEVEKFKGNMIFGSVNQLNFLTTSRRDDLISLFYLIVFLLNKGQMNGIDLENEMTSIEAFKQARMIKKRLSIDEVCGENAFIMKQFGEEVCSYEFEEQPDY